jgi:hypothetical protein
MLNLSAFSALITIVIFLEIGALKIKYFHMGIYKDLTMVRMWKINKAIKGTNNADDIRLLKKLRKWHIAGIVFLGITIVSALIAIASVIRG